MIVIGLLAAIALIVIAAINPIEQANRARDTRFRADSGQIVSALERYFVSVGEFPWVTNGDTANSSAAFGFSKVSVAGVGICGANCSLDGVLISSEELKDEFKNRDFIKNAAVNEKTIFVGKESGSSKTIYACYIPLAKATRQRAIDDKQVYSISEGSPSRSSSACSNPTDDWISGMCVVCVPE